MDQPSSGNTKTQQDLYRQKLENTYGQKSFNYSSQPDHLIQLKQQEEFQNPLQIQGQQKDQLLQQGQKRLGGIGQIQQQQQKNLQQTGSSIGKAFQDLDSFMGEVENMVKQAERYRAMVKKNEWQDEAQQIEQELMDIGIENPVTKQQAGQKYFQDLAQELSQFLLKNDILSKNGGIMTLAEVYCRYNRARKHLVSPYDLLQASIAMDKLDLPIQMKQFPSGVKVLQSKDFSNQAVLSKIQRLLDNQVQTEFRLKGLSAIDLATYLGLPLNIINDYIYTAEQQLILCRDQGPEGLRYYRNFFHDKDIQQALDEQGIVA